MFSKLILIHRFIDLVILLLTGKGNLAREAVDQGICDFSCQGRDKYGN